MVAGPFDPQCVLLRQKQNCFQQIRSDFDPVFLYAEAIVSGMALAAVCLGWEVIPMQATYDESIRFTGADEFAPEDTRDIPFFGFVTGTLISLGLWCMIAWTVWALVD